MNGDGRSQVASSGGDGRELPPVEDERRCAEKVLRAHATRIRSRWAPRRRSWAWLLLVVPLANAWSLLPGLWWKSGSALCLIALLAVAVRRRRSAYPDPQGPLCRCRTLSCHDDVVRIRMDDGSEWSFVHKLEPAEVLFAGETIWLLSPGVGGIPVAVRRRLGEEAFEIVPTEGRLRLLLPPPDPVRPFIGPVAALEQIPVGGGLTRAQAAEMLRVGAARRRGCTPPYPRAGAILLATALSAGGTWLFGLSVMTVVAWVVPWAAAATTVRTLDARLGPLRDLAPDSPLEEVTVVKVVHPTVVVRRADGRCYTWRCTSGLPAAHGRSWATRVQEGLRATLISYDGTQPRVAWAASDAVQCENPDSVTELPDCRTAPLTDRSSESMPG